MTATDDLIARAQAVLAVAKGFAGRFIWQPAHTVDRSIGNYADHCAVGDALVYAEPDMAAQWNDDMLDRDDVTEISTSVDQHIGVPIAQILNDAPAVIRDLIAAVASARAVATEAIDALETAASWDGYQAIGAIKVTIGGSTQYLVNAADAIATLRARLADQARGLAVGEAEIERIILDDPLSEIDAAAEELDPGHILRVNREQRVEIARMRAEIARMRGMLASNRRDFTDGWVACAEYRGVDIDHDALERALDAELAPAERGPR